MLLLFQQPTSSVSNHTVGFLYLGGERRIQHSSLYVENKLYRNMSIKWMKRHKEKSAVKIFKKNKKQQKNVSDI